MQGHLNTPVWYILLCMHGLHFCNTSFFVCNDIPHNTPAWYSPLGTSTHCTYHTCRIQPTLYLKLLLITTYLTDTSYTVCKDVPSNTPARHTPYQDAAYSTPKLYILLCMQRCSIQYTCTIHVTLYGRMLYTTNLYYTSYLVCQDISIKYTLCMSQCSTQHTNTIHSTWYVTTFYTICLHNTFKFVWEHVSDSIPAWFTSPGQGVWHNKLLFYILVHYVSTLQTIQMHDAFYFVCMDAPYNIFARYSLLCTSRFSIQYTYIIHPSLFFIISICQDCQYHNLMQMCANSVL